MAMLPPKPDVIIRSNAEHSPTICELVVPMRKGIGTVLVFSTKLANRMTPTIAGPQLTQEEQAYE